MDRFYYRDRQGMSRIRRTIAIEQYLFSSHLISSTSSDTLIESKIENVETLGEFCGFCSMARGCMSKVGGCMRWGSLGVGGRGRGRGRGGISLGFS